MRALRVLARVAAMVVVAGCGSGASPTPTATSASASPSPSAAVTASPSEPPASPTAAPTAGPLDGPLAWTSLTPGGDAPAGREDHTWTVDEAGGTAYLFGGRDGSTVHGDLWAYNLAADSWQRLAPAGPAPAARFGHEAAWIDGLGLAVFGGQAGSTFFGDLWLFDPATGAWTELPAAGDAPVPRYGSCSAVSPDGRLWISHGFTENGTRFDDTRAYDFELQRWADETPSDALPVRRCLHVCWWTADVRLALYGGQTNGDPALGDLWALTPLASGEGRTGWESLGNPLPADRNLVAAVAVGDDVVIFGGRDGDGRPLADLVRVTGNGPSFEPLEAIGTGPDARWAATLIFDAARARILVFGGTDGATASSEIWALARP
ncbi:MAG: kelch repeat-containing protein [Chloroflexota bacterium]